MLVEGGRKRTDKLIMRNVTQVTCDGTAVILVLLLDIFAEIVI